MMALSVASAVAVAVVEVPADFVVVDERATADPPLTSLLLLLLLLMLLLLLLLSSYSFTRTRGARGAKMSEKVRGVGVITAITYSK